MKLTKYTLIAGALASLSLLTLSSCSDDTKAVDTAEAKSSVLEKVILKDAPENAVTITEIRTTAKPGDEVTFSAKVIGKKFIFMDDRAVMVVGDPEKITSCDLKEDDGCQTPWDVCCDLPEVIKASIVTLQYLDDSGNVVKEGFKGVGEIKELSSLVVNGTVAKGSTDDNMIVNVSGIFVKIN